MSTVTVRTMLSIILENNLQMDDEIHFDITAETEEPVPGTNVYLDFVSTEIHTIKNDYRKQLIMLFDLNIHGDE